MRRLSVLFVIAGGQRFGVPVDQIRAVQPSRGGAPHLGAALGLRATSVSHTLVTAGDRRFAVDALGDLAEIPSEDLRRVPRLVASRAPRALWAACVSETGLTWLLDLEKLPAESRMEE